MSSRRFGTWILAGLLLAARPAPAAEPVDRALQMRIDAVKADPDEPRNHFNLGLEYYNRGQQEAAGPVQEADYKNAMDSLQRALKVRRKDKDAHAAVDLSALQLLGNISLELKEYGDAVDWFEKGLKLVPADPACLYGRGQAYILNKKNAAAREAFEEFLKLTAGSTDPQARQWAPEALTYLGSMAMEAKKFDEAAEYFKQIITQYGQPAAKRKGSKTKDAGSEIAERASKNLAIVYVSRGDILRKKKDIAGAAKSYDDGVSADPTYGDALAASAIAHRDLATELKSATEADKKQAYADHLRIAERNFTRALALDQYKTDYRIWYLLGITRYELEKFDDAIAAFKKAVEIDPNQPDARYNLALSLVRRNSFEEAMQQAEQARNLDKGDKSTSALVSKIFDDWREDLMKRGTEAFTADRVLEAIQDWEKLLELDPKNPDAPKLIEQAKVRLAELIDEYTKRGDLAYKDGDLLTASTEWNAALQLDPENAALKTKLSKVSGAQRVAGLRKQAEDAFKVKEYVLAMKKIDEALALNKRDGKSLALRRRIASAQTTGAKSVLTQVNLDLKRGKLKDAKREIEIAKEATPDDKQVMDLFQKVNKRIEDEIARLKAEALAAPNKDAAKQKWEAVLSLNPNDRDALEGYKKASGGRQSSSIENADKVKALNKKGIFAYMQNNLQEAKKAWEEAIAIDPDNSEIRRSLDRVNQKLKTSKGA